MFLFFFFFTKLNFFFFFFTKLRASESARGCMLHVHPRQTHVRSCCTCASAPLNYHVQAKFWQSFLSSQGYFNISNWQRKALTAPFVVSLFYEKKYLKNSWLQLYHFDFFQYLTSSLKLYPLQVEADHTQELGRKRKRKDEISNNFLQISELPKLFRLYLWTRSF